MRNGHIGFLDAPQQFFVQRFLEGLCVGHARFGVGVLGREVRTHLAAPLFAKPEIVVHALFSVEGVHLRYDASHRRLGCRLAHDRSRTAENGERSEARNTDDAIADRPRHGRMRLIELMEYWSTSAICYFL